jgi:hypothetical protein
MSFVGTDKTLNRARKLKWRTCSSRFDDSIKTGQALAVAVEIERYRSRLGGRVAGERPRHRPSSLVASTHDPSAASSLIAWAPTLITASIGSVLSIVGLSPENVTVRALR